jgi:3',5'-cyclic AMP phosphodiesterase CpdA
MVGDPPRVTGVGSTGGEWHLVVVSDTHLSERVASATDNWSGVVDWLAQTEANLVVHAGDLTLDGIGRPEELAAARDFLDQLPLPWEAVPGNHDIGDTPGPPALSLDRLGAWRDHVGADRWALQVGPWTVLGINAHLLDSGDPEESSQWSWLEEQFAAQPNDAPMVLVLHKPLSASATELAGAPKYRFVGSPARERVEDLLDTRWCPLVVSGHVHQYRVVGQPGRQHAWAPSSWAVLPEYAQATVGLKRCGVLSIKLSESGTAEVAMVEPPGVGQLTLGVDLPDPYDH